MSAADPAARARACANNGLACPPSATIAAAMALRIMKERRSDPVGGSDNRAPEA